MKKERKPNRLINEKSPYLLQHAYNPVDWYPWCEEAFEKAKKEDKPIFLSIGYSTCHWCHVMERESFEDEEIAEILNKYYVPIKVDREERPDIDAIYMSVCQMMTGTGGWPLTIIMTPDKKPFFAGTYFPKEGYYGRPGLKEILLRIAELWQKDRRKILESAEKVEQVLKETERESYMEGNLDESVIHRGFSELFSSFDTVYGGFGQAPKFPIPHNLMFLMRYYRRTKNEKAIEMVKFTLEKMRYGGIWDFVGFGFHRYSTDREWLLPHFEKMLYDNALLLFTYSEAYQITKEKLFKDTAEKIAEYLIRDMRDKEGAFYSAEDADSEGEEGKFYLWSAEELKKVLSEDEFSIVRKVFHIEDEGNFLEEATKRKTGKNILYMGKSISEHAKEMGMDEEELEKKLEEIRVKLFKEREKRVRPLRDEKILTDWNGLAIAGFSKAGVALGREEYIRIAKECADFVLEKLKDNNGFLLHRYKDGEAKIYGFLEDYAYLIWGLTELYFVTFEGKYLKEALRLTDMVIKHFWDEENWGFFQSPDFGEKVLVRKKEIYDGATPSGNSVMAFNLIRFFEITGDTKYRDYAYKTLNAFSQIISSMPSAHTFSLIALDLLLNGMFSLVGVGNKEEVRKEILEIEKHFLPEGVFLVKDSDTEEVSEYIKNMKEIKGKPAYYLCRNFACERPSDNTEEIKSKIGIIEGSK